MFLGGTGHLPSIFFTQYNIYILSMLENIPFLVTGMSYIFSSADS